MELIFASATEQAKAIRERQISSEELVRACLQRIEEVNPKLNAVVQLPAARRWRQARGRIRLWLGAKSRGRCTAFRLL